MVTGCERLCSARELRSARGSVSRARCSCVSTASEKHLVIHHDGVQGAGEHGPWGHGQRNDMRGAWRFVACGRARVMPCNGVPRAADMGAPEGAHQCQSVAGTESCQRPRWKCQPAHQRQRSGSGRATQARAAGALTSSSCDCSWWSVGSSSASSFDRGLAPFSLRRLPFLSPLPSSSSPDHQKHRTPAGRHPRFVQPPLCACSGKRRDQRIVDESMLLQGLEWPAQVGKCHRNFVARDSQANYAPLLFPSMARGRGRVALSVMTTPASDAVARRGAE